LLSAWQSRPRVIDLRDPRPFDAPPFVCPGCGGPLGWVKKKDLHAVTLQCRWTRCHGYVVYELRCRECADIIILREGSTGFIVVGRGSVSNARVREDAAREFERRFERD
jgi:hypothetical protein